MAATSSQLFGNLLSSGLQGFTGGLNKDWSAAFKTPLNTTQTLPAKPETMPGAAGGFMSPDFQVAMDAASKIPNETARGMAIASLFGKQMQTQGDNAMLENYPKIMDMISERQYQNRLRARPLELEELKEKQKLEFQAKVAGGLLDMVTGFPAKITAHRDIVAPMNELMRRTRREGINYGAVPVQRLF